MKTRKVYLLKDDAFTAAQTKTVDINIKDPISSIDVIVRMTTGAGMTEASVVKPHNEFTKIELVDGSDVLESCSMREWQSLNVVELGALPPMELTLETSSVQAEMCTIHFGISKNDPEHFFDPTKFTNPQLKITNTFTAAAATSWAASGHAISVVANIIEEGASPHSGFLSAKEIYAHTAVDGAVETIDMPRDHPYRLIMLECIKTGSSPILTLEKLKLSCDADKYIPYDIDSRDLILDNVASFGMFNQGLKKRITGAGVIYSDLYHLLKAAVTQDTSASAVGLVTCAGEAITMEVLIGAAGVNTVSAAEGVCYAIASGFALHGALYLPFGNMHNPDDWFESNQYGDIKLKLTGESAVGTVKTVIQQLRS